MGAPIPDQPSPADQQASSSNAAFQAGPPAAQLCGFTVPTFTFKPKFKLPGLSFPPPLPSFKPSLGINCGQTNPVAVPALPDGGGRVATYDQDPDQIYDQTAGPTTQTGNSAQGPQQQVGAYGVPPGSPSSTPTSGA
jgi:hypothetical protein